MKGIIVVFLVIVMVIVVWLIGTFIYRTGINYRKKKRDLLGDKKSKEDKEE